MNRGRNIILVNALSVTNQSGLHVLAGHLEQMIRGLQDRCRFAVVCRPDREELKSRFEGRVEWIHAPESTARWLPRAVWEYRHLQKIATDHGADFYFTPAGIAASALAIPQVVLCQNPWALVPSARRRRDFLKAWLQRRAYRQTMKTADVMVFNSEYMRQAYRQNAGFNEKRSLVVYQAADAETRERSEHWKDRPRVPGQIVCVSAMAPHKNVETVLQAFKKLTFDLRPSTLDCNLHLVGSWPDPGYERKIRRLVSEWNLEERIRFAGFVSREELDRLYAESQLFCLMSRCESFGIPAIEAQLFGTPVVCSAVCAVPEICGDGGLFCDPDDVDGIAAALERLLKNDAERSRLSALARSNASKYSWEACSQTLVRLFESMDERDREGRI